MRYMARTAALAQYPILRGLEVIRDLGVDGVEICLENPDLHPDGLDEVLARQIDEHAAALGLAPTSVSYHVDYIYDDALLEQSLKAIALTPAFGTRTFVFGGVTRRTGDEAEWQRMVARTRRLVRAAEDAGVALAQEFEPGFVVGSTADLLRLFAEIPSPALAANSDLGHAFLCDPDPLEAIRQVGDRIVQCHIENMRAGVHAHLLPQEGDMDLAAYLGTLAEVGFDGGLVLDLYGVDLETVARPALEYLRERTPR